MSALYAASPTGPTPEQLEQRVFLAQQVVETMKTPGWQAIRDRARDEIDDLIEETFRVSPEEWAGPKGLQAKGEAIGRQATLNVATAIVTAGQKAEKQLEAMGLRDVVGRNGSRPRAHRVGVPTP